MPVDASGKYWVCGAYQGHFISRMSHTAYTRAHNSTRMYPAPYPSSLDLMNRVDAAREDWYQDTGPELHLSDFVWLAHMQSARRMTQRTERFLECDLALECLMEEGIFDRHDPNVPHLGEEFAMHHSSAMVQRLLMRVERLEAEASSAFDDDDVLLLTDDLGVACQRSAEGDDTRRPRPQLVEVYRGDRHKRARATGSRPGSRTVCRCRRMPLRSLDQQRGVRLGRGK